MSFVFCIYGPSSRNQKVLAFPLVQNIRNHLSMRRSARRTASARAVIVRGVYVVKEKRKGKAANTTVIARVFLSV